MYDTPRKYCLNHMDILAQNPGLFNLPTSAIKLKPIMARFCFLPQFLRCSLTIKNSRYHIPD